MLPSKRLAAMRKPRTHAPDAPSGLPPLQFTPIDNFLKTGLADPVTAKLYVIRDAYDDLLTLSTLRMEALSPSRNSAELQLQLNSIARHVSTLRSLSHVYSRNRRQIGLAKLLDYPSSVRDLVELVSPILDGVCRAIGLDSDHIEYLLDEVQLALYELETGLSSTTPEQLALQTHLEHLVTAGLPIASTFHVTKAIELYGPLFELRNKYFNARESGVLSGYLRRVDDVEASFAYEGLVDNDAVGLRQLSFTELQEARSLRAALLKNAVEQLEVLALLDEATLVDERDAHVSA
jgi:hypothetical protein